MSVIKVAGDCFRKMNCDDELPIILESVLAIRAPEGNSGSGALLLSSDGRFAFAAWLLSTAIDPQAIGRIRASGGATKSGVGDDALTGGFLHVRQQVFSRGANQAGEFIVGQR